MPAIITDSFDYDDIVRVLDLDEAFVHHQIDALQPKYWRVVIKTKPKGLKIFAPVMVSGNRGIDYMIYSFRNEIIYDFTNLIKSIGKNSANRVQKARFLPR